MSLGLGGRTKIAAAVLLVLATVLVGCSGTPTTSSTTGSPTTTAVRSTPPRCPQTLVQQPSPTQTPGPGLPAILPAPLSYVELCRYAAYPGARLTSSFTVTGRTQLALLRREVNDLVPLSPAAVYHCPLDTGARIDAYFGSASGILELRFDLRGCQFITGSNSAYYGLSKASGRLLLEVESLVH